MNQYSVPTKSLVLPLKKTKIPILSRDSSSLSLILPIVQVESNLYHPNLSFNSIYPNFSLSLLCSFNILGFMALILMNYK